MRIFCFSYKNFFEFIVSEYLFLGGNKSISPAWLGDDYSLDENQIWKQ